MPQVLVCRQCGADVDVDTADYRIECPECGYRFD